MADQQRKVSLIFEANASQAKQEVNDLVASLQKIQATPATLIDSKGIKEASKAALELQSHLQKAVNIDTGKLDLNRFANSLSSSGKSLEQYRNTLTKIGPAGDTAFKSLLTSINKAEASTVRLTKGMRDFITTMKNTVKWQISSSMIHSLMGAIQNAYSYAQQLDRSLNDIRIVSSASAEEMARFAVEANRAAQALSTTTTKYTDAALIFYQQGLNDQQVKERTEAVIKMANVTGEASKDVSSYMTAIWNNFADGSKSLEYYADVITKLGAATAASSEEIAGGLEKFAAIGNTIGLSYEYATSMITTIVDKTRQSEDVVGTALKTILARIQGLNLGETLEDGTTLNKYSEALAKVGINIKDASGQLKDMDIILDELGSKWGTFSKDTQIALAQVVGGVRQYNQIISLMNNWESFQKNVQIAESSAGSLNEQADIYAESWEAARNRVKTATQGIYDALFDEKVFIQLDDIFTHLLNGINGVVKGMGGMVPILGTIGGFITQKFAKEMPVALSRMSQNIAILTGKAQNKAADWQAETTRQAELGRDASIGNAKAEAEYETIRRVSVMREQLLRNQHQMNSEEVEHYESLIRNEEAIGHIIESRAEALGLLEKETQELKDQVALRTAIEERERATDFTRDDRNSEKWDEAERQAREELDKKLNADLVRQHEIKKKPASQRSLEEKRELNEIAQRSKQYYYNPREHKGRTNDYFQAVDTKAQDIFTKQAKAQATAIVDVSSALKQAQIAKKEFGNFVEDMKLDEGSTDVKEFEEKLKSLKTTMGNINADTSQIDDIITQLGNASKVEKPQIEAVTKAIDDMVQTKEEALKQAQKEGRGYNIDEKDIEALTIQGQKEGAKASGATDRGKIPEIKPHVTKSVEALTSAMGSLMSAYSAVQAVASAWDTVMDKNATTMEKTGAIIGALMSITMAFNSILELNTTLKGLQSIQEKKSIIHKMGEVFATKAQTAANKGNTNSIWANIAAWKVWQASNPVGWILAIVGAVVALGVALSKIDWRSDEEKYLDNLKEKSEALSKAQENLTQHISEVESAWDNYQNMVTALEECTIGTEAWNEALFKCNQSVLSLLSLAPALGQFVQYNEDGSISLGGIGFEEYMTELTRQNNAIQASNVLLNNKIAKTELNNLYGDKGAYNAINEYIANSMGDFSEKTKFDDLANLVTTIFKSFGEDLESAVHFLEDMGITNADLLASVYQDRRDFGLGGLNRHDVANSMHLFNQKSLYSTMDLWSQDLFSEDMLERSNRAAYTAFFGALKDYEVDNLSIYGDRFEEAIEVALEDNSKDYASEDKETLQKLMVETFKGKVEDYKDISVDDMQYALAVADVSNNLEILNSIIANTNELMLSLNSAGQSLIRTGNLVQANLSKENRLNTVAYVGKQLQNTAIANPYSGFSEDIILEIANEEREKVLSDFEWATANETVNKLLVDIPVLVDTYKLVKYYNDYTMAGFDKIEKTSKVQAITEALNSAQDKVKQLQPSAPVQPPTAPVDSRGGTKMYDARTKAAQSQTDLKNAEQAMSEVIEREQENQDNFFNYIASWESLSALGAEKTQETNLLLMKTTADLLGIDLVPSEQFDSIETAMMKYAGVLVHYLDEIDTLATSSMESLDTLSIIVDSRPSGFPISSEAVEKRSKNTTGMTVAELKNQGTFTTENINSFDPSITSTAYTKVEHLTSNLMSRLGYLEFDFDVQTEYFGKTFDSIIDLYNYLVNPNNQESILNTIFKEFDNQIIDVLGITLEEGQTLISYMQEHGEEYGFSLEGIENGYEQREAILSHLQSSEFAEFQAQKSISSFLGYNFTSPEEFFEMFNADGAFDKQIEASGKTLEELNFSDILDMLFEQQVQAYRNDVLEWNKINSERFKSKLTVDSETGEFISPEGAKDSDSDGLLRGLVNSGASTEDIGSFIDGLSSITAGLTNEAFSDISTNLVDMINDGANASKVLEAFNLILSETYSKGSTLSDTEILKIMEKADLSTAEFSDEILNLTGIVNIAIQSLEGINNSFEKLISTLSKAKGLKDLTTGSELSEEDYKDLEKYIPEEYKDLFMRSANGYTFYGTEEEGLAVEKGSREAIWAEEERNRVAAQEAGVKLGFADNFNLEAEGVGDSILNWIMNSGMNSELFSTFAAAAGIGPGEMEEIRAAQSNNEFTEKDGNYSYTGENEVVSNALVELTNAIVAFMRGDFAGAGAEEAQLKMTGMQSREELDTAIVSGDLDISKLTNDQVEAVRSNLVAKEYEQVGISSDEIQEQIKYLEEFADISHLSQSELTELAASQVRFNRGVETGQDNMSNWIKELKNGEKSSKEYQDAQEGIIDTFGDILDLDWDKSAVKEFAESGENLELMEKALKGDTDALADLESQVAQIDLAEALDIETVPNQIASVLDSISDIANSYDFGDIINIDSPDYGPIYAAFNELTAQAIDTGMGVEEAMIHAQNVLAGLDLSVPTPEYEWVTVDVNEKAPDGFIYSVTSAGSATDAMGNPIDLAQVSKVTTVPGPPLNGQISYLVNKGSGGGVKSTNQKIGTGGRRSGGGGGGGRRGRGGGGSRAPQADKKKDSDKERYHTITNVLEDLTDAYDKVSKASDRAFGKARVKLLEQQEEALVDLMETQEDYLDEIEANLKKDMDLIKSMDFGVTLQFDKNGTLLNFEELQNAMWDEYNSHINDKGEVMGMSDEEWKEYEEKWQERMDALAQYEETQDLWKEAQQQLQDYINQIKDVRLEQVTYAVEVDIEASENALEILEYLLEKIGDSAWDAAEAIANMGEQAQEYLGDLKVNGDGSTTFVGGQIETYRQGIASILGNHITKVGENDTTITQAEIEGFMNGDIAAIEKVKQMGLNGTLTDAEVQSLKDYHSQLLATNQALMDLRDSVHGKVLEAFQQFNDELQEGIDAIVHLGAMMQSYRNIVDIVGKENLSVTNTMLEAIGQAGVENKIDSLGGQKARVDSLRAMIANAEAKAASAVTEEDKEKWKENIEEMKKDLADAEENFMSSWEETLQSIQEQFELAVTNTIEIFSDALSGPLAGSLDELQASFDRQNNLAERFLPEYEKIYELNKLNRDITNSINDTDNVKAKQELAKLQEEINTLEAEGTEVSRFQTEDLRRRYELKLAELALEEAKNAKSNVQMTRNADGNWSYVYTADEEDVAAAEQTYEDRLFAIQRANAEYINEMQNSLIQAQADMASEIEAIMTDETLSMEEKMQKVNEIKEYYTEMFGYYSDELQYVMDQNGTAFEDTTLSALTGFQDLESYNQNFYDAITAMMIDLDEAYAMWEENTEAALEAAGTSIDGFADHLSEQTQAMVEDSDEARESVESLGETAVNTFEDITAAVENWVTQYGEKINEVITKNEALALSFKNVLNEWANFESKDNENPPTENLPTDDSGEGDSSGNESDEPEYMGQITIKKGYQYWGYKSPKGGNKNKVKVVNNDRQERTYKFTQMDTSTARKRVYIPSEGVWVSSYDPDGPKRITVEKFDTGGYTGSWGSEGRMAMLHEKEIVLNKGDTANLLTAVDMIRQVAKVIDLNAYSSAGFGSSIMGMASGSAGQFEQNVHITAEFPNATDRNEIYAAFTDIVNLASQYANR